MIKVKNVQCVTFLSPGSFVSEQTTREIPSWDTALACEMAAGIVERYDARPYAFYFTTSVTADDIPDGLGGTLRVERRQVARSGNHFICGEVMTLDDVTKRNDPKDSILRDNMRRSFPIVCETRNIYKHVAEFGELDAVVDASGNVIERGDSPERIAYRKRILGEAG